MAGKLTFSQKFKCQGCVALRSTSFKSFCCELGCEVTFNLVNEVAVAPKPKEGCKCYKPKSVQELRQAKTHIKNKQQ